MDIITFVWCRHRGEYSPGGAGPPFDHPLFWIPELTAAACDLFDEANKYRFYLHL